jgi:hypothetical protein
VDGLPFHSFGEEEAIWLERAFEEREVYEVVKDMNGDKALGPNGFLPILLVCSQKRGNESLS